MWFIAIGMIFAVMIIVVRLVSFQILNREEWKEQIPEVVLVEEKPKRGVIYDRNGAVLAVDRMEYRVGISPSLITDPEELANSLAPILQIPRYEILNAFESGNRYTVLAPRVSSETADAIRAVEYGNQVQLEEIPRRFYPQGDLMCHVLGFVNFEGAGSAGVEGYYQNQLAGEAMSVNRPISPLREPKVVVTREGADLVLTIDRTVQYTVEQHLKQALAEHGAVSGTIIVMDPRTGAILAMASDPCYSANEFFNVDSKLFYNPIVSAVHEPGSVMKLITMAAALDSGTVTPQTTYQDAGVVYIGGVPHVNWDRGAHGTVDMTTLLSRSLNVGAATIASWMGPTTFYDYLQRFGFGKPTNIDIFSEEPGLMPLPGSELWHESFIGTNAYGQGLAVTPLQMIAAVSALANNGYLMQPYVVQEIHDQNGTHRHEPFVYSQPIKPETAATMTAMAVTAVQREVPEAQVPGYTVAGKTGTAQIAEAFGYHPTDVIGSFIGWLPAEAPEVVIFVKLDRPTSAPWGSMTAAPTFAKLAEELVVLLDIPPDDIRLQANIVAARDGGG
jgi:cell division protein FtsI/penicillin-binding protein 2